MRPDDSKFATVPVGKLGIIVHPSCAELGKRIDQYIVNWRKEREHEHKENVVFKDYEQDTYIIDATCSRFGTGEAKALISDSVRGVDLYILADVLNYSLKYKVKIYLTHDVDSPTLYRSWKGLIRSIRDRRGLYKSFQGKFGSLEKDPFYTFPWFFRQNSILQDLIGKEQCHLILFIRNGGKAKHDKPHYDLRNKDIRKLIKSALEHNVTIGLHSSYQAGTTPSLIRKEKTGLEDHIGKNVRSSAVYSM